MQGFVDFLDAHYINHRYSSASRPQSNSPAERAVRSLKDVIHKVRKIDKKLLREMTFNLNNHSSQDNSGSPAERFFLRGIRSSLQNSFERNLKASDLMKIRSDKRQKLASKQGRISKDGFYTGQTVRIQDVGPKTGSRRASLKKPEQLMTTRKHPSL